MKIFLWGKILGYAAITDYVLTCRFSGSILFSHLLMFPEGFLVLVKIKMAGEGGDIFVLDVPCFKTRNLSCGMQKKANYF